MILINPYIEDDENSYAPDNGSRNPQPKYSVLYIHSECRCLLFKTAHKGAPSQPQPVTGTTSPNLTPSHANFPEPPYAPFSRSGLMRQTHRFSWFNVMGLMRLSPGLRGRAAT